MVGLPIGAPAPAFSLSDLNGQTRTLNDLLAPGKPVILVFSDPGCGPCNAMLSDLARWQRTHAAQLTIAMITRGKLGLNRAKSSENGLAQVLLQNDREVAEAYNAYGTPTAVLVQADGTIGSGLAGGAEAIGQLVGRTTGTAVPVPTSRRNGSGGQHVPLQPATLGVGELAPPLKLPDVTDKIVDLIDFRGDPTLLLFWNPGCVYCERMLNDLKAWEADPPRGAPQVLVVSTGTAEANRALGLRSRVVLDPTFSVGQSFGANGTPMAVLVDARGRIASELVAGAPAIFALAHDPLQRDLSRRYPGVAR
jgi:peroxiredoxin